MKAQIESSYKRLAILLLGLVLQACNSDGSSDDITPPEEELPKIVLPMAVASGGANSVVAIVNDAEKAGDVVSLQVLADNDVDNAYAAIKFATTDLSQYKSLRFDLKSSIALDVGDIDVKLVDINGNKFTLPNTASMFKNTWRRVYADTTDSVNIDLTQVVEVRVAGVKQSDLLIHNLFLMSPFTLANPVNGFGGPDAEVTIELNAEKGKDVINLKLLSAGTSATRYAGIIEKPIDISAYGVFYFDVLDSVDNTYYNVFIREPDGTHAAIPTSNNNVKGEWTRMYVTLNLGLIDLTNISQIWIGSTEPRTLLLSDFVFEKQQ